MGRQEAKPRTWHVEKAREQRRHLEVIATDHARPTTRGECEEMRRDVDGKRTACPFVGCRYHLALDVDPSTGSIKWARPGVELDELPATCALDVIEDAVDAGEVITQQRIAVVMGITKQGVATIERKVLRKLRRRYGPEALHDMLRGASIAMRTSGGVARLPVLPVVLTNAGGRSVVRACDCAACRKRLRSNVEQLLLFAIGKPDPAAVAKARERREALTRKLARRGEPPPAAEAPTLALVV